MADKAQILIVEDDPDLSEMLDTYFHAQGYDVLKAVLGLDAVQITKNIIPDLVMLDIRLPDIDGYEVCRRLRTSRRTQSTPILFLTEKRDRVDKLQGLELGVVDYITKPFDLQELHLRVRNILKHSAQSALTDTVTNLPSEELLDEHIDELIQTGTPWALIGVTVQGLDDFRDQHGFVVADDVLRGLTLMLNNAMRELGTSLDMIAYPRLRTFVIVTNPDNASAIYDRIAGRIQSSMYLFQPATGLDSIARRAASSLHLVVKQLGKDDGPFTGAEPVVDALLVRLDTAQPPELKL
jgi:PleD family two-component response regulator